MNVYIFDTVDETIMIKMMYTFWASSRFLKRFLPFDLNQTFSIIGSQMSIECKWMLVDKV